MTPEQQQSIVKTLQAALTTVEEKWNDKTESQAWMVGYLEGTIKRVIREMEWDVGRDKTPVVHSNINKKRW